MNDLLAGDTIGSNISADYLALCASIVFFSDMFIMMFLHCGFIPHASLQAPSYTQNMLNFIISNTSSNVEI